MTDETLLSVGDLSVRYPGNALGIGHISLSLRPGQIVALVGPNGGGKTSTLGGIAGFGRRGVARAYSKSMVLRGRSISHQLPLERVKEGVVLVPERDKIFTGLTVMEQLKLSWQPRAGKFATCLASALDLLPEIEPHLNRRGGYLSGGQRQMVGLASALCAAPSVLLIDEVTLGLAPALVNRMAGILRRLGGGDIGLLIAEQSLGLAFEIADVIHVLDAGRVVADGTPDELRHRPDIIDTYVGRHASGTAARNTISEKAATSND
ncbi:ATP-binding cassette domain-containing protein [Acidiferrimicrobium sp. IK]|uniref:ABC transporter ATP-binding protein n=1 Tax=Acidiferrimicrobium sp. IK TaxID=2871700 RepID=UPI0021CB38D0|nr:ATP-binding cassette domain-containing protein [Acidiferrimicrobium sp. IK]MCU4183836.1 ATP-binding cassette domain-containing protein [Acidiferrimicrobium sp. IK]